MSHTEAQALLLLAGIVIGEAVLIALLHKLYQWRFPEPFWDAADTIWEDLVWAIGSFALTLTGWAAFAVAKAHCLFGGHRWRQRAAWERCLRCEAERLSV